jgi:hypothetical protein
MKTINHALLTALTVTSVVGCATPFRAPHDVANIKLDRADSPVVRVDKIWLERKGSALVVKGCVRKRLEATDTTQTHLDVTLYDEAGKVLRSTVEHFDPRQITPRYHRHSDGLYRVTLYPLTGWLLSPMLGAVAMSLSCLNVTANALRLRRVAL